MGRSPNPSNAATMGTPARRIAALPFRPTATTLISPVVSRDLAHGEADGVRVERPGEAAVGGEQDDQPGALAVTCQQGMLLRGQHGRDVREHLIQLVPVGARLEGRILGALQLRCSHELHRAGDLLDVLRPSRYGVGSRAGWAWADGRQAVNVSLKSVAADRRPVTISSLSSGFAARRGQDVGTLRLQEPVEPRLEVLDARGRARCPGSRWSRPRGWRPASPWPAASTAAA